MPSPTPAPTEGEAFNLWWLGVILGLLGSIAINTGNNLQSLGMHHLEEEEREKVEAEREALLKAHPEHAVEIIGAEDEPLPPITPSKSKIWVVGTCIFVSGSLLNFASFGFAATQLLASLEGIQFVTNLAFAKFVLGESVTARQVIGTVLIIVGVVVTVAFSSKSAAVFSTRDMKDLYENSEYQVYLVVELVLLFVLHFVHVAYQKMWDAHTADPANIKAPAHGLLVLQTTYATWSALFGTQSVVQAKCLAQLLGQQLDGNEQIFLSWFTYVVLAAWLALTAVWLYRMNEALAKYNPLFMIPLLQINFIFFAILSGGVYFQEFDSFNLTMWIGFWSGVVIQFTGLALLAPADDGSDVDDLDGHHLLPTRDSNDLEMGPTPARPPQPSIEIDAALKVAETRPAANGEASETEERDSEAEAEEAEGGDFVAPEGLTTLRHTHSATNAHVPPPRNVQHFLSNDESTSPRHSHRRGTFLHVNVDLLYRHAAADHNSNSGKAARRRSSMQVRVPQVYSMSAHVNTSVRDIRKRRESIQRRRSSMSGIDPSFLANLRDRHHSAPEPRTTALVEAHDGLERAAAL